MYPIAAAHQVPTVIQLLPVGLVTVSSRIPKCPDKYISEKECRKSDIFFHHSLLQDAESKSETSQAISAREHFVFTDTDGQVYHITVEGNTVKDGARIPPDVSPETFMSIFYFISTWATSRSSTLILAQSYSLPFHISPFTLSLIVWNSFLYAKIKISSLQRSPLLSVNVCTVRHLSCEIF